MRLVPEFIRQFFPWVILHRKKQSVRHEIQSIRQHFHTPDVVEQSAQIVARIESLPEFQQAKVVMLYYPKGHEVDLRAILQHYGDTKTLLLPVTRHNGLEVRPYLGEDHMTLGKFGVMEPDSPTYIGPIDIVLVPGVAFDDQCYRLGRGGGYYDRFLERLVGGKRIGVAFDFQILEVVPHNWLDARMDGVVSPSRIIAR